MFVDVFPVRLYVPAIKIPLSVKVKAIPYANLHTSHRLIYADVINRSRDHSFFIRSLQNPTLKMSRIVRHVNTTQTAIMSAWHMITVSYRQSAVLDCTSLILRSLNTMLGAQKYFNSMETSAIRRPAFRAHETFNLCRRHRQVTWSMDNLPREVYRRIIPSPGVLKL